MTTPSKNTRKNSPRLILNKVSYSLPNTPVRFSDINISFENGKYGITGQNGVGKTTFLRLLIGDVHPSSGSIQRLGHLINVPQNHALIETNALVSDALGVSHILHALKRINTGNIHESDFEIMTDFWDIEKRIQVALNHFNLWPMDLNKPFHQLSGGQKTKILLAKTFILPADFYLFDEPTNNLDRESRQILYQYIKDSPKAMIIVSHDRTLLSHCDKMIEITTKGIGVYGGNYDFYKEQKENKVQAIQQEIQARTEILLKAKKNVQTRMERHQQNEAKGRKEKVTQIKAKGSYDKIALKAQKGRSEKTNRRIRLQSDRKLTLINEELLDARNQLEIGEKLDVCLEATKVPNNKSVISIKELSFGYNTDNHLFKAFNFNLTGPNRIALQGPNGSGKSTLIKLIRGLLEPNAGEIHVGVNSIGYLDQTVSCLDHDLSLIDNFLKQNPNAKPFDAYRALAAFKFRNIDTEKNVKALSGGERVRAGLAISLMSAPAPQIIILDEPTNHLDLDSIVAIETALKQYQGALIAVSHDDSFLKNINITEIININHASNITTK